MATWYVKSCLNQSRLNQNVSYHKIPDRERKDIRDAWIKAIARPVFSKAIHMCSDYFTKVSFDESQELKRHLPSGNSVPSLFPDGMAVNKSVSSNIEKMIKLRKVKVSLVNIRMEKMHKGGFFIPQYLE